MIERHDYQINEQKSKKKKTNEKHLQTGVVFDSKVNLLFQRLSILTFLTQKTQQTFHTCLYETFRDAEKKTDNRDEMREKMKRTEIENEKVKVGECESVNRAIPPQRTSTMGRLMSINWIDVDQILGGKRLVRKKTFQKSLKTHGNHFNLHFVVVVIFFVTFFYSKHKKNTFLNCELRSALPSYDQ